MPLVFNAIALWIRVYLCQCLLEQPSTSAQREQVGHRTTLFTFAVGKQPDPIDFDRNRGFVPNFYLTLQTLSSNSSLNFISQARIFPCNRFPFLPTFTMKRYYKF
jgi:hypothetical protein